MRGGVPARFFAFHRDATLIECGAEGVLERLKVWSAEIFVAKGAPGVYYRFCSYGNYERIFLSFL